MDFGLVVDEEVYKALKSDSGSCGFASPFGGVFINLPLLHRVTSGLIRGQFPELEKKLRFEEFGDEQRQRLTRLIIDPFSDDIYLTKVVRTLDHEAFHLLLYKQEELYNDAYKSRWKEVHHTIIDELEDNSFYTFDSGPTTEPVDLARYVESLL